MNLRKVLFVGGDPKKLASVQIRCVDIAQRLGCDLLLNIRSVSEIPGGYSAYVCVKPGSGQSNLHKLAQKGLVIWDIIDALPPKDAVAVYLASTKSTRRDFAGWGRVEMIPHHHCNIAAKFNSPKNHKPGWIGSKEWCPNIPGLKYDKYLVQNMSQADVIKTMRKIGIGLNFRAGGPWPRAKHPAKLQYDFHVALNSGIKLINCIGFGIPSISEAEPAYREFGAGCTIFCKPAECFRWVEELQSNDILYRKMRNECMRRAGDFHIDTIADKYKTLLQSL